MSFSSSSSSAFIGRPCRASLHRLPRCAHCGRGQSAVQVCAGCHIMAYCSESCAKRGWHDDGHDAVCSSTCNTAIIGDTMASTCRTERSDEELANAANALTIQVILSRGRGTWTMNDVLGVMDPNRVIRIYDYFMSPARQDDVVAGRLDPTVLANARNLLQNEMLQDLPSRQELLTESPQLAGVSFYLAKQKQAIEAGRVADIDLLNPIRPQDSMPMLTWMTSPSTLTVRTFLELYRYITRLQPDNAAAVRSVLRLFVETELVGETQGYEKRSVKHLLGKMTDAEREYENLQFLELITTPGRERLIRELFNRGMSAVNRRMLLKACQRQHRREKSAQYAVSEKKWVINFRKDMRVFAEPLKSSIGHEVLRLLTKSNQLPIEQSVLWFYQRSDFDRFELSTAVHTLHMLLVYIYLMQNKPYFLVALAEFLNDPDDLRASQKYIQDAEVRRRTLFELFLKERRSLRENLIILFENRRQAIKYKKNVGFLIDTVAVAAMLDPRTLNTLRNTVRDFDTVRYRQIPYWHYANFCRLVAMHYAHWHPDMLAGDLAALVWQLFVGSKRTKEVLDPPSVIGDIPDDDLKLQTLPNKELANDLYMALHADLTALNEAVLRESRGAEFADYRSVLDTIRRRLIIFVEANAKSFKWGQKALVKAINTATTDAFFDPLFESNNSREIDDNRPIIALDDYFEIAAIPKRLRKQ